MATLMIVSGYPRRCLFALVLVAGAIPGKSWAQQAPLAVAAKAYFVAEFELRDAEAIRPYSANVMSTFTPFGGRFLARGGRIIPLEGDGPGARTVIIEFPSLERAQAWYDSSAYLALRPIRQSAGISRIYLIEGTAN